MNSGFEIDVFGLSWFITGWKVIGFLGVSMFGSRWLVQLWASKREKKPTFPRLFWIMSLVGSLLLLLYFTFGKNDSVGILSNLFPCSVAAYNLFLDLTYKKRQEKEAAQS